MKDDTILRRAALDALGERPTVWTDNDDYALGERNQYDMDRLAIETVPSVDAVPVVRCNDCKWYQSVADKWCGYFECMGFEPDDYCSQGERKDGDRNG